MKRFAKRLAEGVLVACAFVMLVVLSPALLILELAFDEDDPAESYRGFW